MATKSLSKSDQYYTQKRIKKENRNKIIKLLSEQPLTFKEVIQKSGLSRAVVHDHLSDLQDDGLIEKEYKNGKILNVFQASKLNLVEWFLDQLRMFQVPEELLEEGKKILNTPILIQSLARVRSVARHIEVFMKLEYEQKKHPLTTWKRKPPAETEPVAFFERGVAPQLYIELTIKYSSGKTVTVHVLLNPIVFHVAIKSYEIEKRIRLIISEANKRMREILEEQAKWALHTVDEETEKVWSEVTEWWDKVSIHVPGILTTTYLLDCYVQLLFNHLKDLAKENKRSGITPGKVTIEYLIGS